MNAAALSIVPTPALRLMLPSANDFCYLAARMRDDERAQFVALTGDDHYSPDVAARAFIATPGINYVLVGRDDAAVMAGGFEPLRPGVFEAWAIGTPDGWREHWRSITLTCSRLIRRMLASEAHRIEVTTLESRTAACAWYERGLGMTFEGRRPGFFTDGQAGMAYSRVSGGAS